MGEIRYNLEFRGRIGSQQRRTPTYLITSPTSSTIQYISPFAHNPSTRPGDASSPRMFIFLRPFTPQFYLSFTTFPLSFLRPSRSVTSRPLQFLCCSNSLIPVLIFWILLFTSVRLSSTPFLVALPYPSFQSLALCSAFLPPFSRSLE